MAVTAFAQNGLVRLAYEQSGDSGPAALLLHGVLSDRMAMRPLSDALQDSNRVITMDLRGHGGSSAIHGVDLHLDDLARDALAVLAAAEISGPSAVVGVGIGAAIAQRMQVIAPERVGKAVLINLPISSPQEAGTLRAIAEQAYKGQAESAVNQWLDREWGGDWRSTVPKARVASARRSAASLHAMLIALADGEVQEANALTLPGAAPFAADTAVDQVMTLLELAH